MNNNDIYQKSELGREEVKTQSLGVLPREARTLLIMIDGKKTYRNYVESLNSSKVFAEFGGIAPLFELLIEFQCIELVDSAQTTPLQASPAAPRPSSISAAQIPASSNERVKASQAEFDSTFNNPQSSNMAPPVKRQEPDANYEALKSELATCIEKNAPPEDAWGYLLNLEQCDDASQLLALAQNIQGSSSGNLARSMSEIIIKSKRQL